MSLVINITCRNHSMLYAYTWRIGTRSHRWSEHVVFVFLIICDCIQYNIFYFHSFTHMFLLRFLRSILKFSVSLAIMKMQMKTILRFNLAIVRIVKTLWKNDNQSWAVYRERATIIHCWWDWKLMQPVCRSVWRLLQEIKVLYHVTQVLHSLFGRSIVVIYKFTNHQKLETKETVP